MHNKIIIYTDGGSRGNPGQAALGVVIETSDKGHVKEYSEYLGIGTNNEAEYQAVIFGLKKAKQLAGKEKCKDVEIEVRADSELIVKQLNGEYRIKEERMQKFFMEVWNMKFDFKKVSFVHIRREQNSRADAMVNKELDNQSKKLF
jgi:ribonuclease HI